MLLFVAVAYLVLAVGSTVGAEVSEFPKPIQRCKAGDTVCLASTVTKILHAYPSGMAELGLAAMDPLYFGNLTVNQGGSGAVSMVLSLFESSILGWRNATVTKMVGFGKDPRKTKFEMHVKVPIDIISGLYSMQGRILLIPIRGTGKGKITFTDLEMDVNFKTSVETSNGEDYLKINKVHLDITCKKMRTDFDNLFNDAELSKNINTVLNANGVLLFNEVRHTFGVERGKIVRNLITPLFDKYPYRMLFAEADD